MKLKFQTLVCLFVFAGIFSHCTQKEKRKLPAIAGDVDPNIPQQIEPASILKFDSSRANQFFSAFPLLENIKADWYDFYRNRNYSFAWSDTSGFTQAAQNLHNRINNLTDDGLDDSLYYRTEFNHIYDDASSLPGKDRKDSIYILNEMMLTAQYFMYTRQIYGALSAKQLKELGWNITPKKISYPEYLNSILSGADSGIFSKEPIYPQYGYLKDYLKKYKAIDSSGGWPKVDTTIKKLSPGDSSVKIVAIKKRLAMSGDFKSADTSYIYDSTLANAVKEFRLRVGLKPANYIDRYVVHEMNVPVSKRIEQIIVNMERCRWIPISLGENYIVVNIPDYKLFVYEDGKLNFSIDVVVGQDATKTVIFNDTLRTIAFSPYWNVPYSIYKNEMEGRLSETYLKRNNMEIVGNGRVRQLPGPNNSLGLVKFLFPNSYNIYFHDTPAKDKFNYTNRAFSHGCIRLKEPKKLAMYLLRNELSYTEKVIDSLMHLTKEVQVKLKQPEPVYIGYLTAFVNSETGELNFRKDIYNRDEEILKRLIKK
ncbi:MAG: L,D-transpeptidase family protein [Chitinophagaceae bacterium]|nr:L,D-transpeptidase family protein [Chitinophagaceae bacterium]